MSTFKIVVTTIFSIGLVIGIAVFALSKGGAGSQSYTVVVWGTLPVETFDTVVKNSGLSNNKTVAVSYVKKDANNFDREFIEALSEGRGPDVVILREDSLYKNRNRIYTLPYSSYSARLFKDTFFQGGEIFLTDQGVSALPFMVDPIVMYWNRDIFANNGISQPPKLWTDIYDLTKLVTKKDSSANISKSFVSLGEWRNITNAKEILSLLLIQAGTPITKLSSTGLTSVFNSSFNYPVAPSQSAVNFYTQFSNPTSPYYSWNRSLPSSLNFFLSGDLAIYFGMASEIFNIQQKNANLNFDVASVPQIKDAEIKMSYAHVYGLALVKQSKNLSAGFTVMNYLTQSGAIKALESATNLPPVRRDLLAGKPTDAFRSIFYNSALISRSWIDPEPEKSSIVLRDMIESITSGKSRTSEALSNADIELSSLMR